MTKAKLANPLYLHLESVVNQALPLEYAIRAVQRSNPAELAELKEVDQRIRTHWRQFDLDDATIDGNALMDFAWDTIQVGFPMSRRHGVLYRRAFIEVIERGLAGVGRFFGPAVNSLRMPATAYFRICDLLNGNDIHSLMLAVAQCLRDARDVEENLELKSRIGKLSLDDREKVLKQTHLAEWELSQVDLKKFILGIREPIHLHPAMHYRAIDMTEDGNSRELFGIFLDTSMPITAQDMYRQLREFAYQFAMRKRPSSPDRNGDLTPGEIVQGFLMDEIHGRLTEHSAARLDGLIGPLAGLMCWDLAQQYEKDGKKAPAKTAIEQVWADYPKNVREVGFDAMRKNYNIARTKINDAAVAHDRGGRPHPGTSTQRN